jgi:3' exoribonuclease, RNase T-like
LDHGRDFAAALFAPGVQHVKYWLDTEFIARPYTIDLISIGLVAEDGREFYAESSEVDWSKASLWT